jgi:LPXTG-motif cell wall-anchored protein
MDFNDYDENDNSGNSSTPSSGEPGERRSSNKPFMIGIAFLGGIVILAMLAMIAYVLLNKPPTSSDLEQQAAEIKAQNTAISIVATQTAEFIIIAETQKAAPTFTIIAPTATSLIAVATETPTKDSESTSVAISNDPAARTATVAAFQTQAAAIALGTNVPGATSLVQATSTALPSTGFVDDVGFPALFGTAFVLLLVIFFARKLRLSTPK